VTSAKENRSTALLLLGWLATQLAWTLESTEPTTFSDKEGQKIVAELKEATGDPLSGIVLSCDHASFSLHRDPGSHYLHAELNLPDGRKYHHLFPAGPDKIVDLLDEEMSRASTDRIYLRVLTGIERLL